METGSDKDHDCPPTELVCESSQLPDPGEVFNQMTNDFHIIVDLYSLF